MTTPILGITEISGNQQNQYITANEAFRALEASTNDFLSVDLSAGDVTLTPAQFAAAYAFVGIGHTLTRALTVPASKRAFVVRNAGTQNINATRGTTIVIIAAGTASLLVTDGTPNGLYSISGGGGGGGSSTWGSITGNINSQADLLAIFTALGNSVLSTGVTKTTDTIGLTALNDTTLRLKPVAQALYYALVPTGIPLALRTFPQIDYPLSSIPGIAADGIYIRFVGVNQAGAVVTSAQAFTLDETTLQYGYIIIKRVAGVNTFLDGAAGPRNVFTWPDFAGDNASINEFLTPESNISIVPNAALTIQNSAGVIKGLGINWGTANVNERTKAAANPTSFVTVNPSTILAASLPAAGTAVQVTQYWNGSAMTTMAGANNASVQRFLITIAGTIFLQVGEAQYASLAAASAAIGAAPFTNLLPNDSAVELCRFAARRGATNLADGADAIFSYGSGTASGGSAGAGTNLSYVASPIDGLVQSSTGTSATLPLSTGVNAGLMAPAQNTKLAGINIGTTGPDVPNNTQLNVRLGTSGNLGTAAQLTAVTSITDTTAGRAMTVGFGGLGSSAVDFTPTPEVLTTGNRFCILGNASNGIGAYASFISVENIVNGEFGFQFGSPPFEPTTFRARSKGAGAWRAACTFWHNVNTTVDGNGFIKQASPIVKIFTNRITTNSEGNDVILSHDSIGVYKLITARKLATDGWYIETPRDANGNIKIFVEYENIENGVLIKTFTPDYNNGRAIAGAPADVPEGRNIDVRLTYTDKELADKTKLEEDYKKQILEDEYKKRMMSQNGE